MTADEARLLTSLRKTPAGLLTAAFEAVRQSAEKGLSVATIFVPGEDNLKFVETELQSQGYLLDTIHDLVVIKW